jgi:hypothetical protein
MEYQAPFGVTDPNAGYVNGNPQTGVQGSIPPAASIEFPQREIVNLISSSNLVPDDADLFQLAKGTRSQAMNFADDTGPVNAMIVSFTPAITSYTRGLPLRIRVLHDNLVDATHTSMTLDAGAGAAPVRKMDGSSPANAEIRAGAVIEVTWDGTAWQLTNFGGAGGGGTTNFININIPYVVDTGTVNNIVGPFSPAITVLNNGAVLLVKVANSVTDVTTLKVNALPAKPVKAPDGTDLLPGDIVAGDVVEFVYDGTNFYVRPNPAITSNATINVPSTRFPTVASVLAAITRKTISPTAFLTIQLAIGIYSPFSIYHKDADQIIIKGTMKTARPAFGNFSVTGYSDAARTADSANNIVMLRSRYGTEIQNSQAHLGNGGQFYSCGIINNGPGQPLIQDILITGDNNHNLGRFQLVGIMCSGRNINCANVAVWGETAGFGCYNGGYMLFSDICYASGNIMAGFDTSGSAMMRFNKGSVAVGNGVSAGVNGNGVGACSGSSIFVVPPGGAVTPFYISGNANAGVSAGLNAIIAVYGGQVTSNYWDLYANTNGIIYANGASFSQYTPAPYNDQGNFGAFIAYDPSIPIYFV